MNEAPFPPAGFVPEVSRLPGIEVYKPGAVVENRPEVVDFKCPQCGATTAYSVAAGKLACDHCGYQEAPEAQPLGRAAEEFEFKVETLERVQAGWGTERKERACQRCGGVISVAPDALAFPCPFCGSNKVLLREPLEDVLRPRALIPFRFDPAGCGTVTREWLGKSWMTPASLREAAPKTFQPVYIPYWTFDAQASAVWKAQVGYEHTEHYKDAQGNQQTRTEIEWRNESGKVQKAFNDILVPGTSKLNLRALSQVDVFDLGTLVRYEPRYLAGMQAQAYDIPLDQAWEAGRHVLRERTRKLCRDRIRSTHVRDFRMSLDFSDEQWRYILVPVYTAVYQFGDKPYQILINGQNGRIAGPRPVDWQKFWLVIAAILSPGGMLALLSRLVRGDTGTLLGMFGLFLLFTALVIGLFLFRQAQEMERD